MKTFHKLLERQLRKSGLRRPFPEELVQLFQSVSESYDYYDRERKFLERAMALSSKELLEINQKLSNDLNNKTIAEQTAVEKNQIIRSVNGNIPEAVFRIAKHKIIYVNQAFLELFGYDSEEEVLRELPERFYVNPENHGQLLRRLVRHNVVKSKEILFRRKDGTSFWGLLNFMMTKNRDGANVFDGAVVDITAQKRNEENLQHSNLQLQKANAELDRFVYSASHDLRAPLKSVLGLLDLIEKEKGSDISQYLTRMRQSVTKLENFITDVIGFSLNSRVEATFELTDIVELIEDSILHFEYLPNAEDIHKRIETKSKHPFFGDKKRLQIIFNNLISNAITYRNPSQTNPFIRIEIDISPEWLLITVEDNGIGIAEQHVDKIFNMFYRGTTEHNGSGLGLYIVKEALDKMQGKIKVVSQKNIGTKFTIEVPNQYHKMQGSVGSSSETS